METIIEVDDYNRYPIVRFRMSLMNVFVGYKNMGDREDNVTYQI